MQYVSTAFAQEKLASLLDAAQSEPVMIQHHDQDIAVMLSPKEYDSMRGMNIMEFQQFCDRVGQNAAASGLTEEKLTELLER